MFDRICFPKGNLHDVSFVYSSDPAATSLPGQFEGIISNPDGIIPGDNL